ncbi:FMN-binding protein [Vallitalea okinawensis]|uniref:FMN-binding protein n=1 Tax=Vallitalea okinawensis TaxID=2078660 RepID=UPI000CFCFE3D|nr:FMN-binding protein [Vallitalea okinawensis]
MKIKDIIAITLLLTSAIIGILMISVFRQQQEPLYFAGTYIGTAEGNHGPITVSVTTDDYRILDINIVEEYEMPEVSVYVYDEMPEKMIKRNTWDVDVVTGATYTSQGVINAVQNALDQGMRQ